MTDQAADANGDVGLPPDGPRAFVERGLARLTRGEAALAFDDFEEAVRLAPGDPSARVERGRARQALGHHAPSLDDFEEAVRLEPGSARNLGLRGTARHHLGHPDGALADFDRAIGLDPAQAWLYRWRGFTLNNLGDFRAALADFGRAITLDPNDADAYLQRGAALAREDEYGAAILDFDRAIEILPTKAANYENRAHSRSALDDLDGALADYNEAVRLDPEVAAAYRGRAETLDRAGRHAEADADRDAADRLEDAKRTGRATVTMTATTTATPTGRKPQVDILLRSHFEPAPPEDLTITERKFPIRVRADLQRAVDRTFAGMNPTYFCGIRKQMAREGVSLTQLLIRDRHDAAEAVPPVYEEIDVGGDDPVRCLKNGLWLLETGGTRLAVYLEQYTQVIRAEVLRIQVATPNTPEGFRASQELFRQLEAAVKEAESYRGKILSLEGGDRYSGRSTGVRVHKLSRVERDQVILPSKTLALLERNVLQFVELRSRLNGLGLATKKGLLFYGPPGTGKTHTIHYLAGALKGHTTLIVTAEQVGQLDEYMTLARLLQPSLVVIEDVDLIARDRTTMNNVCEEVLLNKLLNEMDGLRADADILFVLTTNRPEALEAALASRPGRVDQAIEFPLPDEDGRAKLVRLYARGMGLPEELLGAIVRRTDGVSASFIKELMRRSAQFHLERDGEGDLALADVEAALDELLFSGGSLNRTLLGAKGAGASASCAP